MSPNGFRLDQDGGEALARAIHRRRQAGRTPADDDQIDDGLDIDIRWTAIQQRRDIAHGCRREDIVPVVKAKQRKDRLPVIGRNQLPPDLRIRAIEPVRRPDAV